MNPKPPEDAIDGGNLQPTSRSIYRGHSQTGIGENSRSTILHGEQYLDSDQALWTGSLPDDLRPWMTLDARPQDRQTLGEEMEAWSYFSIGGLLCVVRLAAAGMYRDRPVYFSHCRAWRTEECGGGFDPGALIGWKAAFDQPWRESRPQRGDVYPVDKSIADIRQRSETAWKDAVENETADAVQVLGHLFEACKTRRPLVIAVPIQEFVADSPIYHLIAFARAALPEAMKMDCRVRIYTSQPEAALSASKCDLTVVPEDLAQDARAIRRDAMLLDRDRQTRKLSSHQNIDTSYAESVVERMRRLPSSLFAFSQRIGRMPQPVSSTAIPQIYNLAAVFPPGHSGSMPVAACSELQKDRDSLLGYLYATARKHPEIISSEQLIYANEWRMFSETALNNLAFSDSLNSGMESLRNRARDTLAQNQNVDRAKLMNWWVSVPEERRLLELRELNRTQMISSDEEMAALAMDLTAAQVSELLQDSLNRSMLVRIRGCPAWEKELASSVRNLPEIARLAAHSGFWRELALKIVEQFIHTGEELPDGGACINDLNALPSPNEMPPDRQIDTHLLLAEGLERSGHQEASRARINRIRNITDLNQQRRLLEFAWPDLRWNALRKYFSPDPSWYENVRDLILRHAELLASLEVPDLLDLTHRDHMFSPIVQKALDGKMKSQQTKCTNQLRARRSWLCWRMRSALNETDLRSCAIAWLYGTTTVPTTLEEWTQVIKDIGDLREEDLDGLHRTQSHPTLPFIRLFEDDQIADLARACPDLGMVAYLAESLNKSRPRYETVLKLSRFRACRGRLVMLLGKSTDFEQVDWHEFNWDEIDLLVRFSGHRIQNAKRAATWKMISEMNSDWTRASETCEKYTLHSDSNFLRLVVTSLCKLPGTPNSYVLGWLDSNLTPPESPLLNDHQRLRQLATIYNSRGFTILARVLWPEVTHINLETPADTAMTTSEKYAKCIVALCRVDIQASSWQDLMRDACDDLHDSGVHPFRELAQAIRDSSESVQSDIDKNGWGTFWSICHAFHSSTNRTGFLQDAGSILELACVLRTDAIGKVAADVAQLAAALRPNKWLAATQASWYDDPEWWRRLIKASRSSPRRRGSSEIDDRAECIAPALLRVLEARGISSGQAGNEAVRDVIYSESEGEGLAATESVTGSKGGRR